MNKIKTFSFAIALATVSAVAIGAVTSNNLSFGTHAEFEPYYLMYGNDLKSTITVSEEDSKLGFATSRYCDLGFYNFTYGEGKNYADYRSDNDLNGENPNPFEYACIWNETAITGSFCGSIVTNEIFEDDGETPLKFTVYCVFSDHKMTYEDGNPINLFYSEEKAYTGFFGLLMDYDYGVLSGQNINNGDPCYAIPDSIDDNILIAIGDGDDPETGLFGDVLRYMGSFPYFFMAFFGNVSIQSVSLGYTCQALPSDFIYSPYHSHMFVNQEHDKEEHWLSCECGQITQRERHDFAYDGVCTKCGYYDPSQDDSNYEY